MIWISKAPSGGCIVLVLVGRQNQENQMLKHRFLGSGCRLRLNTGLEIQAAQPGSTNNLKVRQMSNFMGASSPLDDSDIAIFGSVYDTKYLKLTPGCYTAMGSIRLAAKFQDGYSFHLERDISEKKYADLGDVFGREHVQSRFADLLAKKVLPIAVSENPLVVLPAIKASANLDGVELLYFGARPRLPVLKGVKEIFGDRLGAIRLAGVRTATREEHEYAKENCEMTGVHPDAGLGVLAWDWNNKKTPVFLVFDMNTINTNRAREVLDFSPGGVSVTKALDALIWCASRIKILVGVCFVGFHPNRDETDLFNDTHQIAVFLLREFIISYGT